MKKIAIVFMLLVATSAQADFLIQLTDGKRFVWDAYYVEGNQLCTYKTMGRICWLRKDVGKIVEVPAGTTVSEYSMNVLDDPDAAARREAGYQSDAAANAQDAKLTAQRKAQSDAADRAKQKEIKYYGQERYDQLQREAGQNTAGKN